MSNSLDRPIRLCDDLPLLIAASNRNRGPADLVQVQGKRRIVVREMGADVSANSEIQR